jgi:chlorobactene glucosyltransferase
MLLYQSVIAVLLIILAINLVLNLRSLKRPDCNRRITNPQPLISVLIPVRNEQENIESCLKSIQKQDYTNFEVIVLDDNSTDSTYEIVERIAAKDNRIRLVKGKPLPPDWAGKPFACYQLSKNARGSWLLFIDADTTSDPCMLRSTLGVALDLNLSLLSGFPRQIAESLPEKIALPMMYFFLMTWLPLWWLHRSLGHRPSITIGQFLLFRKDEYWRIGGHLAVKDRIIEDVWLGVETVSHGGRHEAIDLSTVFFCRMYRNVSAMWEGFVKWIYSIAALSPLALVAILAVALVFYMAPFYWVLNGFFSSAAPTDWRFIAVFQIGMVFLMRWLVERHFRQSLLSTFLHPFGISFWYAAGLYGLWRQMVGLGVRWKERIYGEETGVK